MSPVIDKAVIKKGAKVGYYRQADDRAPAFHCVVTGSRASGSGVWVDMSIVGRKNEALTGGTIAARPSQLRVRK